VGATAWSFTAALVLAAGATRAGVELGTRKRGATNIPANAAAASMPKAAGRQRVFLASATVRRDPI